MEYQWTESPLSGDRLPLDPWTHWVRLRMGSNSVSIALCESATLKTPRSWEKKGWKVPSAYAEDAAFFTARNGSAVQGIGTSVKVGFLPAPGPHTGGNPDVNMHGNFKSLTPLHASVLEDLHGLHGLSLGTPQLGSTSKADLAVALAKAFEKPNPFFLAAASEGEGGTPRPKKAAEVKVPADGKAGSPVIGVIDTGFAFLNSAFRTADNKSRILALWDQSVGAEMAAPWQPSTDFGYGRVLTKAAIDSLLSECGSGAGKKSEVELYGRVDQPAPAWSHGTQVLALAAGSPEPIGKRYRQQEVSDPAAAAPIIAVQISTDFIQRTHGNWLNGSVLDALQFIVNKTPAESPVVVNISMGAYSGPHDGTDMLDRAIDSLVTAQKGRLTVVVAAGNSRIGKVHARQVVAAGGNAEFSVETEYGDPTPNFIEAWCMQASIGGQELQSGDLTAELSVNSIHVESPLKSGAVVALLSTVMSRVLRRSYKATDGVGNEKNVGLLHVCAPRVSPNGKRGAQILACIGPSQSHLQPPPGDAPKGRWTLTITNNSKGKVVVNAWMARDNTVAGDPSTPRKDLPFAESTVVEEQGTMSNLAWSSQVIAVGGYAADLSLLPTSMFIASGAGFDAALQESPVHRAGPDLCGPATINGSGVAAFAFRSGGVVSDLLAVGTSMAAPVVTRQLVNQLAAASAFFRRDVLIQKLKATKATAPIDPVNQRYWTSDYWLPLA